MNYLNKIKRCFSMVEIILAIAVMGAGLTLILVLFPIALTSARDVTDNTYVPSIGSHFMTLVRARVAADCYEGSDGSVIYYSFTAANSFINSLLDIPLDELDDCEFAKYLLEDSVISADYGTLDGTIATEYVDENGSFVWYVQEQQGDDGLSEVTAPDKESISFYAHNNQVGRYLVLFKSPSEDNDEDELRYSNIDFAAEVNIVKAEIDEIYPYESGDINYTDSDGDNVGIEAFAATVYVHISWPIEVPMSARKSKIYSLDLYNSALGGIE